MVPSAVPRIRARLATACSRALHGQSRPWGTAGSRASVSLGLWAQPVPVSFSFCSAGLRWRSSDAAPMEPREENQLSDESRNKVQGKGSNLGAATPNGTSASTGAVSGTGTAGNTSRASEILFWVKCERGAAPELSGYPPGFAFEGSIYDPAAESGPGMGPGSVAEAASSTAFDITQYRARLTTERLGRDLLLSRHLASTQALVAENRGKLPEGAVCVAYTQSAGKGRGRNSWSSPEGALLFSTLLIEDDGRKLPMFQYVVALSIVKAIEAMCAERKIPALPVRIKWPNDLYAALGTGAVKVGGILCNSTYSDKRFSVVAGVGLNIDNREPTTCLNELLASLHPGVPPVSREECLAQLMNCFEPLHKIFRTQGFSPMEEQYTDRWLHRDQEVLLSNVDGAPSAGPVAVTIKGLTQAGYLLAADSEGRPYELSPDGNSFDFFQGLIGKKLQ